jgi:hypothetical protein
MAFTRKFLIENGVPEDKVDIILAERNRTLKDYVPQSDVQAQIDAALEAAKKEPQDITNDPKYIELLGKTAKLEAFQTDDFSAVKKPYMDIVWQKLDHAEKHKPYKEQIEELASEMPDLFIKDEDPPKPSFGSEPKGSLPSGKAGSSFMDTWGFVPKRGD